MTESWAPDPPTPEEEADYRKHIEEASEDEPPQLNPHSHEDPDDPPQIDRRPISERLAPDPEPEKDGDEPPAGKKAPQPEEPAPDKAAESGEPKQAPEPEKHPGDPDTEWFKALPDEAKKHYRGMKSEMSRVRESRRNDREAAESRFKSMAESIPQQITKAIEALQAKASVPDPDMDPDGHRKHLERQLEKYEKETVAQRTEREGQERVQREFEELNQHVLDQEGEFYEANPDYFEAKKHGIETAIQRQMDALGVTREVAQEQVHTEIARIAEETRKLGGNVAHRLYRISSEQYGYGKAPSNAVETGNGAAPPKPKGAGESAAESIVKGQAASKGLGKGGGTTTTGKRTLKEIWEIKDPGEHQKAYDEWVAENTGQSDNWRP